ncbi:hypothetical protein AVEN_114608-1 [Araneus ventricosus]|uniref:Uncharacterized protein n=1 Tax=Araneus ventricosus TaxID=182803 RepID=A0A4Y2GE09_ARAVE|nr:hypothetical protein AVEN_114608-1 [Araneus ventricosus]
MFPLKDNTEISIAFRYSKTLKKRISNYNFYGKNLDLIEDSHCYCNEDKYAKHIDKDKGQNITGDLGIVDCILLQDLMGRAAKFRLRKKLKYKKTLLSICKDFKYVYFQVCEKIPLAN